jgi:putative peptidoglycan lipid II flippase
MFTLLSRFVGLWRDIALASHIGPGDLLDAYNAAFRVPDFMFNLLVLGTLSVAFIPVFTQYFLKDRAEAEKIANTVLNVSSIAMAVLMGTLFIFLHQVTAIIVPGFTGAKLATMVQLTRLFLLSPIIFTISNVFGSMLNSWKRFLITSIAPVLYNCGIIFGIYFLYPHFGAVGLAYGVLIGAGAHLVLQASAVLRLGWRYSLDFAWRDRGVVKIFKLFVPLIISLDPSQVSLLIATIIGSTLASGSISIFNFASNLQAVALGIFALSVSVAAFPSLSEAFAKHDEVEFASIFRKSIMNILFFVLPISLLMVVLRTQIVRVTFERGAFNANDAALTSEAFGIFASSLWAQALAPLFSRVFYARQNTVIPVLTGLVSIAINAVGSYYLGRAYGVSGLVAGFTISAVIDFGLLYIFLVPKLPSFELKPLVVPLLKLVAASVVMAAATYAVLFPLAAVIHPAGTVTVFIEGFAAGVVGILVFAGAASALKIEQARYAAKTLRQKWV